MWFWTITDHVRFGNANGVAKRLDAGDSVDERRWGNYTPLIYAAFHNKCEMIELLLDKGADIEAVDNSGLSALRTAIYYRYEEAAILLATRGADADKIAYQQKTALHAAVKDGQLAVVRAILLGGAELTIKSDSTGKTAIDYVSGNNGEELKNLLMKFVNLQMAIEAESCEAVSVLLKKTLSDRATMDDAVNAYQTIMAASVVTEGEWKVALLTLVEQFEINMLYRAAHSGSIVFVDSVTEAIGKQHWVSFIPLNSKGSSILHVAASKGHTNLVNHLLNNYDCDSVTTDFDGNKASDLVNGNDDETSKHIYWILIQHEKKTKFMELSSQLLLQDEATTVDIHKLPCYMTSIYDLRTLYCLACGTLTTDEMKELLEKAFKEAIQEKLMFDDHAALFFKKVLRECLRLELISKERKDFWKIQARHVNMENADWVREIQNSLVRLEHRVTVSERNILSLSQNYSMLRSALETKIRLDGERIRRRQLIGLVTAGLFFCGGSLLDGALNFAFDLCETAEALIELTEMSADELTSKLSDAVCKHALKPRIQALLEQACIDQREFKDLLQDSIALEKSDASKRLMISPRPTTKTTKNADFSCEPRKKSKLHFRDVVQMVTVGMDKERWRQKKIPMLVDHSHLTETVLEGHPYHYAVLHSLGDLNEFKNIVKHVVGDDMTMDILVPVNLGSISFGEQGVVQSSPISWKKIQATAATHASYLGYVDIVEWFLRSGPASEINTRIAHVLINRAGSIHKRLQTPTKKEWSMAQSNPKSTLSKVRRFTWILLILIVLITLAMSITLSKWSMLSQSGVGSRVQFITVSTNIL